MSCYSIVIRFYRLEFPEVCGLYNILISRNLFIDFSHMRQLETLKHERKDQPQLHAVGIFIGENYDAGEGGNRQISGA